MEERKYIIEKINKELEKTQNVYLLYKIHNFIECVNRQAKKLKKGE